MKKIVASIAVAVGVLSTSAFAAPMEIVPGTPIQPGNQGCELLAEAVTINLSSNVHAAYNCIKANNVIRVAACHKGGSRKQGTIACAKVNEYTENGSTVVEYNDPSCERDPTGSFPTDSNGKGFVASTSGGSAAAMNLGSVCNSVTPLNALIQ